VPSNSTLVWPVTSIILAGVSVAITFAKNMRQAQASMQAIIDAVTKRLSQDVTRVLMKARDGDNVTEVDLELPPPVLDIAHHVSRITHSGWVQCRLENGYRELKLAKALSLFVVIGVGLVCVTMLFRPDIVTPLVSRVTLLLTIVAVLIVICLIYRVSGLIPDMQKALCISISEGAPRV
jgi:hypothetical protein